MKTILATIAGELDVREAQVAAAVALLDEGATVPFISRYRKEVTGGLDDTQLRNLEARLRYLRELEERRGVILGSIRDQGKLTDELEGKILAADSKSRLEDLYLPYKPKRRTKGQIAIEAGLEPLADKLLANPELDPDEEAGAFLNSEAGIESARDALDGARFILMERFAEDADLINRLRSLLWDEGLLQSAVVADKERDGEKFSDYFEHRELLRKTPSHRALAMFRGRAEGVLSLSIALPSTAEDAAQRPGADRCEAIIAGHFQLPVHGKATSKWLAEVVRWTWRVKLSVHLEMDLFAQLRERAEADAIGVFAANLKDLLLAAPAGPRPTIGLDPGLRTGVKVAVIDATGQVVDHGAIFPTPPQRKIAEAEAALLSMIRRHGVELIAIGNGTASRETERFVGDLLRAHPELGVSKVMVNESGASIYSASPYAAEELPDLDVTIRGAVSIARRLQDPLAELVKIEPKSIGVGQYQHDVSQMALSRTLDAVIEDCVNAVGVDVNTASSALLSRISGLNTTTAQNLVEFRNAHGMLADRATLRKVPRIGDKTFELAAGFLRVMNGSNPLDRSAVHPESYAVVERIARQASRSVDELIGDAALLRGLRPETFVDEQVGLPTIRDIFAELEKPGRDPRPEFRTAAFKDGVEKLSDLREDMILEGVVTNVTNFGAFVDVGVHQDGLVHISCISDRFVKDPRDVVKAGDIVKVKVMEVDVARKRIGLSMRLDDKAGSREERTRGHKGQKGERGERGERGQRGERSREGSERHQRGDRRKAQGARGGQEKPEGALAAAFAAARRDR
ncbi:MAG: Tex family protein [Halieaceae bacterium]|jgi:uncharacterized protein|nr:Tex family protein [Halieaceae bacterium]